MDPNSEIDEIDVMRVIKQEFSKIDEESRLIVLRWANERYGRRTGPKTAAPVSAYAPVDSVEMPARALENAAELLAAARPSTEAEKALVAGYWFQEIMGQSDLEAQVINTELKHLGHGVANITRALDALMRQRPQPVIQLRKSGNSKQARKKYKLTTEGVKRVRQMLQQDDANSSDEDFE